ncbi:class I SAM-dependent methyltransferase [Skermania sp. ID1734]|uniref:class I SAM-dependent methyltransferase n=1 Tax=Skermania sp. ID1734 TaxID=2597516 RepID=UPI001181141A|nr:class I SAM-dependent methyltransferase [Skermania sp. ID1734]TSD93196.1 class I SAM-dependent methyltransferase [Skermania sp. ID1734]
MAYNFTFGDDNLYGHVVRLLDELVEARGNRPETAPDSAVHLDIGCGYGAVAEALRERGYQYVGLDIDEESVGNIRERGFEAWQVDLRAVDRLKESLDSILGDRQLRSITMLDIIEHLADGRAVLSCVRQIAEERGLPPLIVSVPNVTHRDLGIKLLTNRWQYTQTGLLDHTHLRFFTEVDLEKFMGSVGWRLLTKRDFEMLRSDQHFPMDSIALSDTTPLGAFLQSIRELAGYGSTVNQFVRAYSPGDVTDVPVLYDRVGDRSALLSVIVPIASENIHQLGGLFEYLERQEWREFELIVTGYGLDEAERAHCRTLTTDISSVLGCRTAFMHVDGKSEASALNAALECVRGKYVSILVDDIPTDWPASFVGQITEPCVQMLVAKSTGTPAARGEASYKNVDRDAALAYHGRHRPISYYAFPWQFFGELGFRFDESEERVDYRHPISRALSLCGVQQGEEATPAKEPASYQLISTDSLTKLLGRTQKLEARCAELESAVNHLRQPRRLKLMTSLRSIKSGNRP